MSRKIVPADRGNRWWSVAGLAALLLFGLSRLSAADCFPHTPVLYLAIATHSEDQPNYSANKILYTNNRNALVAFAHLMAARHLKWNWESDWNFLNAAYTNEVLLADTNLLASTANTNIVAWLRYVMGVATDPHSHENGGYNYADVAYLFTRLGVTPSGVVGGHIYDPAYASFSNWPKFTGEGLRGTRYPQYVWRPALLMGGGTPNHIADPVTTGIWLPAGTTNYLTHSPTGTIAAWSMWGLDRLPELLDLLATNGLPTNRMWTAGFTFGQGQFNTPGYLTNVVTPMIDMLAALRDAGRIQVVQFEEGLNIWTNEFGAIGTNYQAPSRTTERAQWPVLSPARLAEGSVIGTVAGRFSTVTNRFTANTNATWQFVSGPGDCHNAEFILSSNGVLRAAIPFDHETQPVRYIRVRASITDSLSAQQFFALVVTNIVTDDDDRDGHTEAQEILAGTDPLDPNSVMRFTELSSSGTNFTATWASVPARTYVLQTASDVLGPYLDVAGTQTNATANLVMLDFSPTNAAAFFRLRLVTP